jgi:DtxR family transcriptional regulator, Mn-dependent transcriptional regulator
MSLPHLSESTEMYLKAMAELGNGEVVAIGRLAERLAVTPVSANEMVKRLGDQGLVSHTPYKGVNLTKKGHEVACDVLRRQRLWEVFLYKHLNIEWAKIYALGCSLEHATAPEVTEALADFLGHPKTCPRGNPIPAADGSFTPLNGIPLSKVAIGKTVRIVAIRATATDVLKHLQEHDILPGRKMTLLEAAPMEGPLTLAMNGNHVALGLLVSEFIIVEIL